MSLWVHAAYFKYLVMITLNCMAAICELDRCKTDMFYTTCLLLVIESLAKLSKPMIGYD